MQRQITCLSLLNINEAQNNTKPQSTTKRKHSYRIVCRTENKITPYGASFEEVSASNDALTRLTRITPDRASPSLNECPSDCLNRALSALHRIPLLLGPIRKGSHPQGPSLNSHITHAMSVDFPFASFGLYRRFLFLQFILASGMGPAQLYTAPHHKLCVLFFGHQCFRHSIYDIRYTR